MGDHRLPKRVMSGELENAGKRGPGGKEKEWTDCVADDLRLFGVTGDWKTAAFDPGAWYNTVQKGGCRFMAAWVREEKNASNQRQKKREAEEADKVEVAPGVSFSDLCILLFLFLSLCRFLCVCVFLLLSLELGRCSFDLFLSSRPRTGLATTCITGYG